MSETEQAELASITAQLQGEIARHGGATSTGEADGALILLARLRELERVNSHLPIGWPVMPRGLVARAEVYAKKIARLLLRWYIVPLVDQQNAYNRALADAVAWLAARRDEQERAVARLAAQAEHQGRDVAALAEQLRDQQRQLAAQAQDLAAVQAQRSSQAETGDGEREALRLRLQRLENRLAQPLAAQPQPASAAPPEPDAFLLGLRFRSQAQVGVLLHDYDDLFVAHLAPNADGSAPRALDIGCGRGELAAHLATLGYEALGVDLDADAIFAGQAAGRPVALGDALAHLATLEGGSLALIVALQVVEHLTPGQTLSLLRACQRALRPGGLLVLETINPTCLYALAHWFLIDPSHQRPVHPETLRLLLEQAEFTGIALRYLHPVPDEAALTPVPDDALLASAGAALTAEAVVTALNGDIARLNGFLYGAQDYAALAIKPEVL